MAGSFLYFAYGPDMHPLELGLAAGVCSVQGPGMLMRHSLRFHTRSAATTDVSGKCDACRTGRAGDAVHGVLYSIRESQRQRLAELRREGRGYAAAQVRVVAGAEGVDALAFLAEPDWIDGDLIPYDWYVAIIAGGARIQGLPAAYQARLRTVQTMVDRDRQRAARQFEIARGSPKIRSFFRTPRA
jgi:gamma-glutamylcyclotransferase